jgi:hypothetical protein
MQMPKTQIEAPVQQHTSCKEGDKHAQWMANTLISSLHRRHAGWQIVEKTLLPLTTIGNARRGLSCYQGYSSSRKGSAEVLRARPGECLPSPPLAPGWQHTKARGRTSWVL